MTPKTRAKPVAAASVTTEETPYGVRIDSGGHALRGDETVSHGGADTGPTPFGLLLSGLGACTAITCGCTPSASSGRFTGVDVELSYLAPDRSTRWIDRMVTLHGPLDDEQRAKLAEIAEKTPSPRRCVPNRNPHDDPADPMTLLPAQRARGAVAAMRPPVAPTGWPREMPAPLTLRRSKSAGASSTRASRQGAWAAKASLSAMGWHGEGGGAGEGLLGGGQQAI